MVEAKKAAARSAQQEDEVVPDSEDSDEEDALPEMDEVDAEAAAKQNQKKTRQPRLAAAELDEPDPEAARARNAQAQQHLADFEMEAQTNEGGKEFSFARLIRQQNDRRAKGWKTTAEINADLQRYREEEELEAGTPEQLKPSKLSKAEQQALRRKINNMDVDESTKATLLQSSGLGDTMEQERDELDEEDMRRRRFWAEERVFVRSVRRPRQLYQKARHG